MRKLVENMSSDAFYIAYKLYRTANKDKPISSALSYASELSSYILALVLFDVVIVPSGMLMASFRVPFSIARYIMLAGFLLLIVIAKKFAAKFLNSRSITDDQTLFARYRQISVVRWIIFIAFIAFQFVGAALLGVFYNVI